jgi:hypothetical protein
MKDKDVIRIVLLLIATVAAVIPIFIAKSWDVPSLDISEIKDYLVKYAVIQCVGLIPMLGVFIYHKIEK